MSFVEVHQGTTPQAPTPPVPPLPANPGQATGGSGVAGTPAPALPGGGGQAQGGAETESVVLVPPPYRKDEQIPREVIPILGIVFGSLVVIVLGYPIVRLFTRIAEKAADKTLLKASDVNAQLKTLQNSIDTMAIEIERISESQRFQDRLLAEREPARLPESRGGA